MNTSSLLRLSGVVSLLLASTTAFASGKGFPIGEKSRVHTNLDLGVVFDTNPDRFTNEVSDWRMTVRPGLAVNVPGEHIEFNLGGKVAVDYYFGTGTQIDRGFVGGDVGLDFRAGSQKSVIGLEVSDHMTRTPSFFANVGTVGAAERRFRQWYNVGNANLVLRPGGGALEVRLGYSNRLSLYDDLPQSQRHGVAFETLWKFFPKTALVFNADLSFFSAENQAGALDTLRSSPYNITLGLRGQLTQRLTAELAAGLGDSLTWNTDFFSDLATTNQRTVIARVMLAYAIFDSSEIAAGYDRTIVPIIQLNSYSVDSPYLRLKVGIGPRLNFQALGRYEFRNYQTDRSAHLIIGDVRAEYWFFDFLNASLAYQLMFQDPSATTSAAVLDDFSRHQVLFTVGFRY
jgi:hypothetical protein